MFSRGTPAVLAANAATPGGAIAWRMDGGTNEHALNEQALAVFNTAPHASLLDNLDIGLPAGTRLEPLFARLVERAVLRDRRRGSTWTAMRIP